MNGKPVLGLGRKVGLRAGLFAAACMAGFAVAGAQQAPTPASPNPEAQQQTQTTAPQNAPSTTAGTPEAGDGTPRSTTQTTVGTTTAQDGSGRQVQTVSTTTAFHRGKKAKADKDEKVVASKDTKKAIRKEKEVDTLAGVDSKLPDKQLYDKAVYEMNKGHFDVARLDLQTMLNTYPDSQYQMRAKLAIADSWYKEGGTAALTQAESEYSDFRVFFPNAPEAAEAQMRIGDIYFRQMDRPDRDYAKAVHAEEEYRRMLTDYPNAPPKLMAQAKQRLRDVQEVLASREADIASFYATRENWAATIARYQTVIDTYPEYSHMDDALIGEGDAYEAQARFVRTLKLPEGPKQQLEAIYDGRAADAYREVVLNHSAAPHVEDARDRLDAMGLKIPTPTKEQVAASEALENSRAQYQVSDRLRLLVLHSPDTVTAARIGNPSLTDPKIVTAPEITKQVKADFEGALSPATSKAVSKASDPGATFDPTSAPANSVAPAGSSTPAKPLAFQEVGTTDAGDGGAAPATDLTPTTTSPAASRSGSAGLGVEILNSSSGPTGTNNATPATATPVGNGLSAIGPKATTDTLPPVEKATSAPEQVNDVAGHAQPAAQQPNADGSKTKAAFDKKDESSSKHKKKKGLDKVNPF